MSDSKYQEIYKQFQLYTRDTKSSVVDWEPMGKNSIKVFMDNGDVYQYNGLMHTQRLIRQCDGEFTEELFRKRFAINLVTLMYENGYTQRTLAEELGVSQAVVHKYIQQTATPSAYILTKLTKLFDCTIDDLMQD